jgi:nucleotide-binding universal stress UspA family protein
MKILVPVDGSPTTKRMLGWLAAHEEWLSGAHQYTMLHSVPQVPARAAAVIAKETLQAFYDEEAEKVFAPIRAFFARKPELKIDYLPKHGPAADMIASMASNEGYDLIIMGSHGQSSIGNLIMGSVATKVLAHCGVPVLLIR